MIWSLYEETALSVYSEVFKTSLKSTKKSHDCCGTAAVKVQPPFCYSRIEEEADCICAEP